MTTNFPNALDSFTPKVDGFDRYMAADVNNLQDAVAAVEAELGTSPKGLAATVKARLEAIESGWTPAGEIWTYNAVDKFTVPGDQTAKYKIGTLIKWTQTTVKFGVVANSSYAAPDTTVTIIVNTDYVITNAAIGDNFYSYLANPRGWPGRFNFSMAWYADGGGNSIGNGSIAGKFEPVGGKVIHMTGRVAFGTTTALGIGVYRFGIPGNLSSADATGSMVVVNGASYYSGVALDDSLNRLISIVGTTLLTAAAPGSWGNGTVFVFDATLIL